MTTKKLLIAGLGMATVILSGCTHQYKWKEYEISDRIPAASTLNIRMPVAVVNGATDKTIKQIGNMGVHSYEGSEYQLSQAVVDQLSEELTEHNVVVVANSSKRLTIRADHPRIVQGMWTLRADFEVFVTTGDGITYQFDVSNSTPTNVPRAFNGVIAKAVVDILNNPKILEYLRR